MAFLTNSRRKAHAFIRGDESRDAAGQSFLSVFSLDKGMEQEFFCTFSIESRFVVPRPWAVGKNTTALYNRAMPDTCCLKCELGFRACTGYMVEDDIPASFQKPVAREPWEASPRAVAESTRLPDLGMKGPFLLWNRFRFSSLKKKREI
jgi:hypothetical protein